MTHYICMYSTAPTFFYGLFIRQSKPMTRSVQQLVRGSTHSHVWLSKGLVGYGRRTKIPPRCPAMSKPEGSRYSFSDRSRGDAVGNYAY